MKGHIFKPDAFSVGQARIAFLTAPGCRAESRYLNFTGSVEGYDLKSNLGAPRGCQDGGSVTTLLAVWQTWLDSKFPT